MRSFFKIFFASLLSLIVFSIIGIFIFFVVLSAIASSDKPKIGTKGVLVLDLNKHYFEQQQQDPIGELTGGSDNDVPGLYDVIRLINFAKKDSAIRGIYIKCNNNANGFAASEELRNAILDFKKGGKFVVAYGDVISQNAYYVANVADKVYCNPQGSLDWRGFSASLFFIRGTLEKLNIQPQIFYAGKFKSATEPLREYKMTEANRIQTSVYINDLYGRFLTAAAQRSKLDTGALHQLANTGAIQTANDAVKHNLINGARYDDEVKAEINQWLKIKLTDKTNFVSLDKYKKAVDYKKSSGDRIAIIYAEGEIVDGKGDKGTIGSDEFKNIIRKARFDKNIKAIVLRVNSPGGSALASEIILRELILAKKEKPVIVSFGDVAASGGYYIAAHADSIFAQPNTITGSIGVFGIIPNMEGFFKQKLGVTFDGVKTGLFADMPSVSRPLNEAEKRFIQNSVDAIYHTFKTRVSEGRKKPMADVDSIAQGRVWTGERALSIGLVDKLGNLQDAINSAARMAKLKEYRVKEYPERKGFIESILGDKKEEIKKVAIKEEIGEEQYEILKRLRDIKKMIAIPQCRLPYDLKIN
ncbi:MAG TPA: signal peptide peptidase SppA [Segetibacter sp.]